MRLLIAAIIIAAGTAQAEAAEPHADERSWHFGIEGSTDFPLQVGAQVWLETPYRFRITMSSGEMPDAYLQTINYIAVAAGAYNQSTANFITELIDRAATWRLQVGWRPFRRRGAYVEAGFGILDVDKGLALASVIQLATSFPIPPDLNIGFGYRVHTVVETLGVETGWIWYPWRELTVRASLGFAAPVGAQIKIEPNFASTVQRPFVRFAESYGEELLEKYLFIPTVGLALGWRLF
jgi:hypothetical protein